MSFVDTNDAKEQIRQAVDIVDLVRDYLGDVQHDGRGFKALCPWHDDSRPSLKINPERQSFKCWVCDIGGDIFSFVMQYEGVAFPEALSSLAQRAGVQLKGLPGGSSKADRNKKLSLYEVMAWAERKYHECLLRLPDGEPARKYLRARGINQDSIVRFHLGAAPGSWNWIQGQASREGVDLNMLADAGVLGRRESGGRYYDRFYGRLLFSIRDPQSRPVAFGGRVLPEFSEKESAKYVNSPETPLFAKHKLLYGLDVSRDAIRDSRTAVVVEGYTDCVMAQQFGVKNVVAVLGTALGETHVKDLGRLAERIILVLDGDEAGRRRANEVLEMFIAGQVDLRILTLPENSDPCDFLLQQGAAEFQALLEGAADALEHKFRTVSSGLGAARGTHEASAALEDVLATLAKAPRLDERTSSAASLRQARVLSRLAHLSGVEEVLLRRRLTELRRVSSRRAAARESRLDQATPRPRIDPTVERWERLLLEAVLIAAEMIDEVRATLAPDQFASPPCRAIFSACCTLSDRGEQPTFKRLMLEIDDPRVKSFLVELDEEGQKRSYSKQPQDVQQELRDILASFRHRHAEQQQGRDTALLKERRIEDDQAQQILVQIIEQQRARQGLS